MGTTAIKKRSPRGSLPQVLTLVETAELLRLPTAAISELVDRGQLPGRKIGEEYRFLRRAVEDWLQGPSTRKTLLGLAGALKGDPFFPGILDELEKGRKRTGRRR
jgi:excisionase family DNA binding protein